MRGALEAQDGGTGFHAVRRDGDDWYLVDAIWKDEMVAKGAVWIEFDGLPVDRDFGERVCASVKDYFSIYVHEEASGLNEGAYPLRSARPARDGGLGPACDGSLTPA